MFKNTFIIALAVFIFSLTPAKADVFDGLVEKLCHEQNPFKFEGVYSGITLGELQKIAVQPINFVEMGSNSADLGDNVTVFWPAFPENNPVHDDHKIYDISVQRDTYMKPDWDEKNTQQLYDSILAQYGEPSSKNLVNARHWSIDYLADPKILRGKDNLFNTFTQNCLAESGEVARAHKMLANSFRFLSKPVFSQRNASYYKKAILEISAKCPNAMQKDYNEYLEKFLVPTASYSSNSKQIIVGFDCPAYTTSLMFDKFGNTDYNKPQSASGRRGR